MTGHFIKCYKDENKNEYNIIGTSLISLQLQGAVISRIKYKKYHPEGKCIISPFKQWPNGAGDDNTINQNTFCNIMIEI